MVDARSNEFRLLVRAPEGRTDLLTVQCDRVLIGSAAHCEVRLPTDRACAEHVELTVVGGRVRARARALEPAPTIGGRAFVEALVEPGAAIGLGGFEIVAEPVAATDARDGSRASGVRRRVVVAATLGAIALLTAGLAARRSDAGAAGARGAPPPLWGPEVTSCPESSPVEALAMAREKRLVAEGKRERRPFHVQDGVAAVPLFETAAACYAVARDDASAGAARRAAADLRGRVQEDYHAHQVRLDHALLVGDAHTARREVQILRALTEAANGPYVAWLSDVDRRLQLRLSKESPR